jgi:hypothetical protein
MTIPVTLPPAYFDAMYQAAADPWGFGDRWYEQRKYAVSLAMLPAVRYRSAFEPGCSIGGRERQGRCDRGSRRGRAGARRGGAAARLPGRAAADRQRAARAGPAAGGGR